MTKTIGPERLKDGLSFRVPSSQRIFLERFAEKYGISLCEAARRVLDAGIKSMT